MKGDNDGDSGKGNEGKKVDNNDDCGKGRKEDTPMTTLRTAGDGKGGNKAQQ